MDSSQDTVLRLFKSSNDCFIIRYKPNLNYITVFLVAFILSLLLTPIVRMIMLRLGVVNKPNKQRWNQRTVALMGGIAIFTSFLIATLLNIELDNRISIVLSGAGIIFFLGVFDDLIGTHPAIKFGVQFVVAVAFSVLAGPIRILPYTWLNQFLTVFWIIGITNAFRLIS